jgi:hypothetical protein
VIVSINESKSAHPALNQVIDPVGHERQIRSDFLSRHDDHPVANLAGQLVFVKNLPQDRRNVKPQPVVSA